MPKTALTRSQLETYSQQRLPNFQQLLELAKKRGKIVIFDLNEPPVGHIYHKTYINQTLGSIAASGIQHDKVRLREERRGRGRGRERENKRERGRGRERERERERREREIGERERDDGRILTACGVWQRNYTVYRGLFIKYLLVFLRGRVTTSSHRISFHHSTKLACELRTYNLTWLLKNIYNRTKIIVFVRGDLMSLLGDALAAINHVIAMAMFFVALSECGDVRFPTAQVGSPLHLPYLVSSSINSIATV